MIEDHNNARKKEDNGKAHKSPKIAGMISILDDVKSRLEKTRLVSQPATTKKPSEAELRRCSTDLRQLPAERSHHQQQQQDPSQETEVERLRKQLSASLVARKSLEKMFSSLGKEKEIMAAELARKVNELAGMEEHLDDLRAQNEKLVQKAKAWAAEHKERSKTTSSREGHQLQGNPALLERNKALTEQLLKSLEVYRTLKRKYKEKQEDVAGLRAIVAGMAEEIAAGLQRINELKQSADGDMAEKLFSVELVMLKLLETKAAALGGGKSPAKSPVGD